MFLQASPQLELPSRYVPRKWIEKQYEMQLRASQDMAVDVDAVNAKLNELHASPGGLQFIGKELRSQLLREMLYESITRNFLQVYKLSQGESAEFYADIDVTAAAIGISGLPGLHEVKSAYTRVDTRLFASAPYVRWNVQNITKFDIMSATQQRLKASLMLQESAAFFRLLRYASGLRSRQGQVFGLKNTSAASNNAPASVPSSTPGRLSIDQLAKASAGFGSRLIRGPKKLYINPVRQSDLVLFNFGGAGTGGNGFFAPNTQEMLLSKGNTGNFLGMEIYEDVLVPETDNGVAVDSLDSTKGTEDVIGYILGPAEFVGVEAIRTDLQIETQKNVSMLADQICGVMEAGFYIRYAKALQRLTA
jgi:hypothetical protein